MKKLDLITTGEQRKSFIDLCMDFFGVFLLWDVHVAYKIERFHGHVNLFGFMLDKGHGFYGTKVSNLVGLD